MDIRSAVGLMVLAAGVAAGSAARAETRRPDRPDGGSPPLLNHRPTRRPPSRRAPGTPAPRSLDSKRTPMPDREALPQDLQDAPLAPPDAADSAKHRRHQEGWRPGAGEGHLPRSTQRSRRQSQPRDSVTRSPEDLLAPRRPPAERTASDLQQKALGVLDALLDADQELNGFAAVDQPVIVRERDVHHRAHDDRVVDDDRALLNGVQAQDAALGRIQDRRRQQRPVDAAVGDRERAAFQLVQRPACCRARGRPGRRWPSRCSANDSRSASRSTGTTSPLPPPTATPMS